MILSNPSFHRIDDLPIQWEAIERQDGILICHAVGGQPYITQEVKRLRKEFLKFAAETSTIQWSTFFMRPVGLTHVDFDLTRHEC